MKHTIFAALGSILIPCLIPFTLLAQDPTSSPQFDPRYYEALLRTITGMRDEMPFHDNHIAMTFVNEYNLHVASYPDARLQIDEITKSIARLHKMKYEIDGDKMTSVSFLTPILRPEIPGEPLEQSEAVFKVVEQMPRFPGCENQEFVNEEKERCAQQKMLEYVYENLKYPENAKNAGVQGRAVVQFIVERDGSITNVQCIRDIGYGCGEESVRVIESMNQLPEKWTPGLQRGVPVRVQFVFPVSFKL